MIRMPRWMNRQMVISALGRSYLGVFDAPIVDGDSRTDRAAAQIRVLAPDRSAGCELARNAYRHPDRGKWAGEGMAAGVGDREPLATTNHEFAWAGNVL
jgi:hypothetical protein